MRSGPTLWDELAWRYARGVATVSHMLEIWAGLEPTIDSKRYDEVLKKLSTQVVDAAEWPQVCLAYFQKFSRRPIPEGISDGAFQQRDESR
jgi:alpha-glucuronidase